MNRYVIGSAATGEIVRSVRCDSSQVGGQVGAGEVLDLSDDAAPDTHYFSGAAVLAYTPQQASDKRAARSGMSWSNLTMAWTEARTLARCKADRWSEIKAARDAAIRAGFVWSGKPFDSDLQSQIFIEGAAQLALLSQMASQPFSIDFTLQDNTIAALSAADMLAVGQAMGVHIMTQHGTGRGLRDAIGIAATVAAVQAVAWPA